MQLAAEFVVQSRQHRLLHGSEGWTDGDDSIMELLPDGLLGTPTTDMPTPSLLSPTGKPLALLSPSGRTPTAPPLLSPRADETSELLGSVLQLGEEKEGKELLGSMLQLPDSQSPEEELLKIYSDLYSYFGDALATRLAINTATGRYIPPPQHPVVSLRDEDAKKTGEELLQTFLTKKEEDEMEIDDKSEKSSRSEHSGGSDESANYFDTDLTVKTSDDSKGIKLTIFKRPKKPHQKASPSVPRPEPQARQDPKRRQKQSFRQHHDRLAFFENHPLISPYQSTQFIFMYAGCEQRSEPRKKSWSFYEQQVYSMRNSQTYTIGLNLPSHGKFHIKPKTRKQTTPNLYTATLSNIL